MVKKLRSFIAENFPYELRVEIELLSLRRDIVNAEKQDELIKILRKYNIEGIVPLGSGTNRYAFKLKGFVVKVATDDDGKIDNAKEFKMAEILYPAVTKTYEISRNNTLLIAEYIEPYSSYSEMLSSQDKIRKILSELSSSYLIGDVGITSKNYANWGTRIGSDEPVCLDFAYVYRVGSDILLCHNCHNHSMLVPDSDFTKLICPSCGKKYTFEDIRVRIGDDMHAQEIGDLADVGYLLDGTNVETELDPKRSTYLKFNEPPKKEDKKEETEKIDEEPDPFVMVDAKDIKEENKMAYQRFGNVYVINTTPVMNDDKDTPVVNATPVAFSMDMDTSDDGSDIEAAAEEAEEKEQEEVEEDQNNESVSDPIDDTVDELAEMMMSHNDSEPEPEVAEVIPFESKPTEPVIENSHDNAVSDTTLPGIKVIGHIDVVDTQPATDQKIIENSMLFNDHFLSEAYRAPYILSKKISNSMNSANIFNQVRDMISDSRIQNSGFYNGVSHSIDHALLKFCNFSVRQGINKQGKPCKNFFPPENIVGKHYEPSMIFMARIYEDEYLSNLHGDQVMEAYMERYQDYQGLQPDVDTYIREELPKEFAITAEGINTIMDFISSNWYDVHESPDKKEETNDDTVEDIISDSSDSSDNSNDNVGDTRDTDRSDVAFSMSMDNSGNDSGLNDIQDDGDTDINQTDEDEIYKFLSVDINKTEEGPDGIVITTPSMYGVNVIPIYTDFDEADGKVLKPSMISDKNGYWDWLSCFEPLGIIRTQNPDKYLNYNKDDIQDSWMEGTIRMKFIILDETEQNDYLVGMYILGNIDVVYEDDSYKSAYDNDEYMIKLNNIVADNIGISSVSALVNNINVDAVLNTITDDKFDEQFKDIIEGFMEDDGSSDNSSDDLEDAALNVVTGNDQTPDMLGALKPVRRADVVK